MLWKLLILGIIKTLEKGIETNLGDKAVKMSGGQKQRLALARIFYQL